MWHYDVIVFSNIEKLILLKKIIKLINTICEHVKTIHLIECINAYPN
jgi:hypothetical protein